MNFDYHFGSDYYNYYNNIGIKSTKYNILAPEQSQSTQPGMEFLMWPQPIFDNPNYKGSERVETVVLEEALLLHL